MPVYSGLITCSEQQWRIPQITMPIHEWPIAEPTCPWDTPDAQRRIQFGIVLLGGKRWTRRKDWYRPIRGSFIWPNVEVGPTFANMDC